MVGSIWGYVFLAGGSTDTGSTPPDTTIPPQQPTTIQFNASNIQSDVIELLPSIILTAPTNNTDVDSLRQLLTSIDGIDKIASAQFTPSQGGNTAWVFIAELQLKNDADRKAISEKISAIPDFSQPQAVATGIISLPETVTFTNDLNLTQEHKFPDPRTNAYLAIDTIPGDKITTELQASFTGTQMQNLIAFEQANLTAGSIPKRIEGSFKIAGLEDRLSFSAITSYSRKAAIEARLKDLISEKAGDANSSIAAQNVFPELKFVFTKSYIQQDLNTFFTGQAGVLAFDFSESDINSASIFFDETMDFDSLKSRLESELNSLNFAVKETIEPEVPVGGEISLNAGTNIEALAESLSKSFGAEGLQELSFSRIAVIEAAELTDADGASYAVAEGKFPAKIKLGYLQGDDVELTVIFNSQRGNATDIVAEEKTLADVGQ